MEIISARFSKIGSKPKLDLTNIYDCFKETLAYLKNRLSEKVSIRLSSNNENLLIPINRALFEWVIENTCKNAVDAMKAEGQIDIQLLEEEEYLKIYIIDSGKGLNKSDFRSIFKPGYSSKKRGWGLGLSLSKRIIDEYHGGKIYVKSSELNKGTTFCISLKKS